MVSFVFALIFYSPAFAKKLDPCLDMMINFRLMNKMKLIIKEEDLVNFKQADIRFRSNQPKCRPFLAGIIIS